MKQKLMLAAAVAGSFTCLSGYWGDTIRFLFLGCLFFFALCVLYRPDPEGQPASLANYVLALFFLLGIACICFGLGGGPGWVQDAPW